ncbi:putative GNAT family acetyltransferase [Nocardioides albertanoniae]|uniref:Putative GNAT family acetyltransferase n=1 Tax=Nocardioides albertanoniae TaxID=1175486 RepID=A0A543AAF2_9ACTN|nr:GNAT family N-acetyltransferase [Nocardioides albertanoniae]TQL69588.1 putative GNAT family acetyltransferase [Nocardioides albertanoniae]
MVTVEFCTDPAEFLAVAADYLAEEPVVTSVLATNAARVAGGAGLGGPYEWFAVAREAGRVVGAAMRTAPFEPYPLYVCPMPEEAAIELARQLHARGEYAGGANGALPAARIVAEETVRLAGGRVSVAMASRLHELGTLEMPADVPGRARPATYADLDLCRRWLSDFGRAARDQSENPDYAHEHAVPSEDDVRRKIDEFLLLWEVDGDIVSLAGATPPAHGVARVAPVYTPEERRGHGYGTAVTAESSRLLAADGTRLCLFTDVDNPISNHVYAKIGYRPVVDMANHTLLRA